MDTPSKEDNPCFTDSGGDLHKEFSFETKGGVLPSHLKVLGAKSPSI